MSQSVNASSQAINNTELGAALESALSEYFGVHVSIIVMNRRASEYRSSFIIEEIEALEYYDSLVAHGERAWTADAFLTAFEFCRLHVAVQLLGWFGRRRAFSEHAQDWLGEALRLSDRLGL